MSEEEQGGNSGETPAAKQFEPITSQDDLNRVIAERIQRERSKYADYDDLKSKASRFDELEQQNKSALEKATERAAELEAERDAERATALRYRVAAKHGISDEDAELFLTGKDEETLTKQAERLSARNADSSKTRTPKPDPNQGRSPIGSTSTADQFAAAVGDAFTR